MRIFYWCSFFSGGLSDHPPWMKFIPDDPTQGSAADHHVLITSEFPLQ